MASVEQLNKTYGVPDAVKFVEGENGFIKAVLTNAQHHSSAEIFLFGAHVSSWKTKSGEHLFMSDKTVFEHGKPLRGGIPICWPQFSTSGPIQNHGFARNVTWEIASAAREGDNSSVSLRLNDNEATRKIWNHSFSAIFTVKLSNKLNLSLHIKNQGSAPFSFTGAMHSYFSVSDIQNVSVTGLKGLVYIDKTKSNARETEQRQAITINQEVDRIYVAANSELTLVDSGTNSSIKFERSELPEVVVWNPWTQKAKAMADLGEHNYDKFVCVELGRIEHPCELGPGQEWTGTQSLEVLSTSSSL